MRWFKHYSDNYRGRSVTSFHREFGHVGVSWYYLLTEICAEKLEKPLTHDITEAECTFRFDKAFVESALRGTFAKIERWLRHGDAMGLWKFTTTDFELHLEYPILLELLDSDQKKTRSRRDKDASVQRLEKNRVEKNRIDKEREGENLPTEVGLPPLAILWNNHSGKLPKVIKTNRERSRKSNIRIKDHSTDEWIHIFNKIANNPFLNGKNDRGWKATFDWILQPETSLKVLEGKYDQGQTDIADIFSKIDFGDAS